MKNKFMEVANFTCKFGEKNLLDFFEDWFLPTIQKEIVDGRKNTETKEWRFLDLKLVMIENEPALTGRFVKILEIKQQQILIEERLVESDETMPSVPSSFFVLLLNNHRLLWVRETTRAPELCNLEYCLKIMLNRFRVSELEKRIKEKYKELGVKRLKYEEKEKIMRQIYQDVPPLYLQITPLSDVKKIDESLKAFQLVQDVQIKANLTNNEQGSLFNGFLDSFSESHKKVQSKVATVNFKNSDGLNKEQAADLMKNTASGNYKYKVSGKDEKGNKLKETEQTLNLRIPLKFGINETLKKKAISMVKKYFDSIDLYNTSTIVPEEARLKARKLVTENNDT